MKAEELMIGDWVYDGCINRQVTDSLIYDMCENYSQEECDEIISIPITLHVLECNDFVWSDVGDFCRSNKNSPEQIYISVSFKHDGSVRHVEIKNMRCHCNYDNIEYVHEFQHALRLCGLNDLANNFKI